MIRNLLKTVKQMGIIYSTYHTSIELRYWSNFSYSTRSYHAEAYLPSGYKVKELEGYSTQEEALKAIEDWIERNARNEKG